MTVQTTILSAQAELPFYDLALNGVERKEWQIESGTLELSHGHHDVFTLDVLVAEKDPLRWEESPISFRWGVRNTGIETFQGYVAKIAKDQKFQQQPLIHTTLMGPTWKLAGGRPNFWSNVTSQQIAQDLTTRHRVGLMADPHPYVWREFAQSRESDWGTLVKLANRLGFLIYTYRGVVRLIDPLKAMKQPPIARLLKSTNPLDTEATLIEFLPATLSDHDRSVGITSFGYLSGGEAQTEHDDSFQFDTGIYVQDSRQAKLMADSIVRRVDRWKHRAEARVRGNASLVPGVVVDIVTGTVQTSRDTNDGLWLVVGATHTINRNVFQTSLRLARNDVYAGGGIGSYRPFWDRRGRPSMFLTNGRWTSNWQGAA